MNVLNIVDLLRPFGQKTKRIDENHSYDNYIFFFARILFIHYIGKRVYIQPFRLFNICFSQYTHALTLSQHSLYDV